MGLRIQNNVEAFDAHGQLTGTARKGAKAMEKLSSGQRANRAAAAAAGRATSEKMRGEVGGRAQVQRNAQNGISLIQTVEAALNEMHSMLERVRELKVQYANGALSADDKATIVAEATQLATEITDIRDKTEFNDTSLLNASGSISLQVGANTGEPIAVTTADLIVASGAGAVDGVTDTASWGAVTIDNIDEAFMNVSTIRGYLGAVQDRLQHRLNKLATYQENLVASESRIRDVDMAAEMVNFTKLQILQQAGTSMLAQANQAPQGVLSLLH